MRQAFIKILTTIFLGIIFLSFCAFNVQAANDQCKAADGTAGSCRDDDKDCTDNGETPMGFLCDKPAKICCVKSGQSSSTANPASPTSTGTTSGGTATYKNQEKIPGFEPTDSLTQYLQNLYHFGIATAALLAVVMVGLGAFIYVVTSAGNAGKMADGKDMITSALYGLVLAMLTYLIFLTINPDFLSGTLEGSKIEPGYNGGSGGPSSSGPASSAGSCSKAAESTPCGVEKLKNSCFGSQYAEAASAICNYESGANRYKASTSDQCNGPGAASFCTASPENAKYCVKGKPSFSWGLFQVNLTQHDLGMGCRSAFSGSDYSCVIKDEALFKKCVNAITDEQTNINYACKLRNGRNNWDDWKTTINACGIK